MVIRVGIGQLLLSNLEYILTIEVFFHNFLVDSKFHHFILHALYQYEKISFLMFIAIVHFPLGK